MPKRKRKPIEKLTKAEMDKQAHEKQLVLLKRLNMPDAVEALGFAGLVAVNYYGIDILGMFLGQATKVLTDAIEATVEAVEGAWNTLQGEGHVGIPSLGGTDFKEIAKAAKGMPSEEILKSLRTPTKQSQIAERKRYLATIVKRDFPEEKIQSVRDQIADLEGVARSVEENEVVKTDYVKKVIIELDGKRLLIALGMAYAEKKFLESYNYFKAVENIPLVE